MQLLIIQIPTLASTNIWNSMFRYFHIAAIWRYWSETLGSGEDRGIGLLPHVCCRNYLWAPNYHKELIVPYSLHNMKGNTCRITHKSNPYLMCMLACWLVVASYALLPSLRHSVLSRSWNSPIPCEISNWHRSGHTWRESIHWILKG